MGDEEIQKTQPFKLIKEKPEEAEQIIADLVQRVWRIATMLQPFMPETAEKIQQAVRINKKPETLFPRID